MLGLQTLGEGFVTDGRFRPQIEARCRGGYLKGAAKNVQYRVEFFPIQCPVGLYMLFVIPGGDAGQLVMNGHGTTVIGAVTQKPLQHFAVASGKTGAQAGQIGALGQRVEDYTTAVVVTAHLGAGFQQPGGRFVAVDFRIALVRGDDKVVLIRQLNQGLELGLAERGPGGVAGGADEQQLGTSPGVFTDRIEVRLQACGIGARQVHGLATGQQRGAFVNLVEGVGHQHQRLALAIHHRLGKGKQGFPGAVYRQDLAGRVDALQVKAALEPLADGLTQFRDAGCGWVVG